MISQGYEPLLRPNYLICRPGSLTRLLLTPPQLERSTTEGWEEHHRGMGETYGFASHSNSPSDMVLGAKPLYLIRVTPYFLFYSLSVFVATVSGCRASIHKTGDFC